MNTVQTADIKIWIHKKFIAKDFTDIKTFDVRTNNLIIDTVFEDNMIYIYQIFQIFLNEL